MLFKVSLHNDPNFEKKALSYANDFIVKDLSKRKEFDAQFVIMANGDQRVVMDYHATGNDNDCRLKVEIYRVFNRSLVTTRFNC